MKQLVTPWYGGQAGAGACLYVAQLVVGAGGGPYSATVAANATKYRHHNRDFPSKSICVLWFDHWGTYQDYRSGEFRYENWGHVVIWAPNAFGVGQGGFFSSRRWGFGDGEWFRTVAEVEAAFSSKYRFWSEDLNGVRVCEPVEEDAKPTPSKPSTPRQSKKFREKKDRDDMIYVYLHHGAGGGQHLFGVFKLGQKGTWWQFTGQESANQLANQLGNAMAVKKDTFNDLKKRHS